MEREAKAPYKLASSSHMVHSKQGGAWLRGPRAKKMPKMRNIVPRPKVNGAKLSSLATRAPMPETEEE